MAFIPDEAVDRMTELSAGGWRLYCFLARCRNQKTGKCCPSISVTMETIGTKRSQTFELRKELIRAGWANFDGNHVTALLGFNSPENRTADSESKAVIAESPENRTVEAKSPENRTDSPENWTPESGKSDSIVRKTGLAYKEEPAKEPAKREREEPNPVDDISSALCDQYQIPDTAGWRLRDKFQHLAIEIHGVGGTVGEVRDFCDARHKKPGVEFFLGDFVAWRASQNGRASPETPRPAVVTAPPDYRKKRETNENRTDF